MEIDWLGYSLKYDREVALIVRIQIIMYTLQHLGWSEVGNKSKWEKLQSTSKITFLW